MTSSTISLETADGPIGFLDSGVGGLPYLARSRELMPSERYVYFADRAHFPYGSRGREDVRRIVLNAVEKLILSAHPRIIVVACNTASVVSLAELRSTFSLPFVGVVPAIKPAGEMVPRGRIGVLATRRTVDDPYVADLLKRFAPQSKPVLVPAGGLVDSIESGIGLSGANDLRPALAAVAAKLTSLDVDVVVLACTHFIHVREQLQELLGDDTPVLDSVEGVARQLERICPPGSAASRDGDDQLIVTGPAPGQNYQALARSFGLILRHHDA